MVALFERQLRYFASFKKAKKRGRMTDRQAFFWPWQLKVSYARCIELLGRFGGNFGALCISIELTRLIILKLD